MPKDYSLKEIADLIGTQLPAGANASAPVTGVCSLEEPKENCISFSKSEKTQVDSNVKLAAVIVSSSASFESKVAGTPALRVTDPTHAIAVITEKFFPTLHPARGVSAKADIDPTAKLGNEIHIGAFTSVGARCVIGDGTTIYPSVVVYHDVKIGRGCVIHSGAVIRDGVNIADGAIIQNGAIIGADGFGYYPNKLADGSISLEKFPQIGGVNIAPKVEIGANTCIDRGALGATEIGYSSKLDNLVQVGHNVKIGAMSILCGQVGVAGSAKIGSGVTLGGGVGVKDHVTIGDKVRVAAKSGVTADITEADDYAGYPVGKLSDWKREVAAIKRLPAVLKELRQSSKK